MRRAPRPDPTSCRDGKLAALAALPSFAGLRPGELTELGRVCELSDVGAGVVLHRQGAPLGWLLLLLDGTVLATHHGLPEAMLRPGDHVGASSFEEGRRWTLLTLTPATVLCVDRRRVVDLLERYPGLLSPASGGPPRKNRSNRPSTPAPCSVMPPSTTMV